VKGQGTLLTEEARTHNVKLVVLSIGGNDFSFSDTVSQCAMDFAGSPFGNAGFCYDGSSVTPRFAEANVAAVRTKLVNAYEDFVIAMRAAGYPDDHGSLLIQTCASPIPYGDNFRFYQLGMSRFNNGCPFWSYDADWANDHWLPATNNAVTVSVEDFSAVCTGTDVHVGVWSEGGALPLPGSVYHKNESFHPNYWGQLALRGCLRQAYNNGNVRGGRCEFMQDGLNAFSEPTMILTQP
jgi:hypothetical protein